LRHLHKTKLFSKKRKKNSLYSLTNEEEEECRMGREMPSFKRVDLVGKKRTLHNYYIVAKREGSSGKKGRALLGTLTKGSPGPLRIEARDVLGQARGGAEGRPGKVINLQEGGKV